MFILICNLLECACNRFLVKSLVRRLLDIPNFNNKSHRKGLSMHAIMTSGSREGGGVGWVEGGGGGGGSLI